MPPESLKRPPIKPLQIMLDMTNNIFANSKLTGACLNSSSPSHHHKLLLSYIASVRIQFKTVSSIPMKTSSLSVNKIWFKPLKPLWLNAPVLQYIVSTLLPYLNQKGNPCQTLVWIKSVAQGCEYLSLVSSWFTTIHPCKGSIHMRITQWNLTNRHSRQGRMS